MSMSGWHNLEGFPQYEINDQGEIRHKKRGLLKSYINARGYHYVQLYTESGKKHCKAIHRLVDETFRGSIVDGYLPIHADGDRSNNRLSNLKRRSKRYRVMKRRESRRTDAIIHGKIVAVDVETRRPRIFKNSLEAAKALDLIEEDVVYHWGELTGSPIGGYIFSRN